MAAAPPSSFYRPVKQGVILFACCLAILGGLWTLYSGRWIFLAVLLGIGLGTLILPIVDTLRRWLRLPRSISALVLLISFLTLAAGLGWLLVHLIVDQLVSLLSDLPKSLQSLQNRIHYLLDHYPWLQREVGSLRVDAALQQALGTLVTGFRTSLTAIAGFIFVVAVSLYFVVSSREYKKGLLALVPAYMRGNAHELLKNAATTLRRWAVGQGISLLCIGTATAFGLWLIGVDRWILFGTLTGILDVVPYLGPVVSCAIISLYTLASDPNKFLLVILVFTVIQQLEAHIVLPIVMKGEVRIPPIYLMAFMLLMGDWFGILGVFIAPALFAILHTAALMTYIPVMDRKTRPISSEETQAKL